MNSDEASRQHHFSRLAESWIDLYERSPSFRERLDVVARTVDALLEPGDIVLDFGSGAGVFSMLTTTRAELVVAVDENERMLRAALDGVVALRALHARRGLAPRPERITHVVGDVNCLRPSESIDLVLAIAVLEYVADPVRHLQVLSASLRPGGHMILTLPRPASILRRLEKPLDTAAARLGRFAGKPRLANREYSALRPAQRWDPASFFATAGLKEVVKLSLRLGQHGLRRHVTPNELFVLRREEPLRP